MGVDQSRICTNNNSSPFLRDYLEGFIVSGAVLLDDYFMPDIDAAFAKISHGVTLHIEKKADVKAAGVI